MKKLFFLLMSILSISFVYAQDDVGELTNQYVETLHTVALSLGYMLAGLTQFIINVTNGWVIMLAVMLVGSLLIIYFRFFAKKIPDVLNDENP